MSKSTEKVTVILSHQQEVGGKTHPAGAKVDIDPRVARVLISRGSAKSANSKTAAAVTGANPAKSAEKEGK